MGARKAALLIAIIVALSGAIFIFRGWHEKPAAKTGFFKPLASQLSSGTPLVSDETVNLGNLPKDITKDQATAIKRYRLGDILMFRVGRASGLFPYYGPDMDQAAFRSLPSGVFASADKGQSWTELIASDSVGNQSPMADLGPLEPAGIFVKDDKMFADFATHGGDGVMMRMSSLDGKQWAEYGCYDLVTEKYADPFSLDPTARCVQLPGTVDNWVAPGQKPPFDVNQARETLLAYLVALKMGWYDQASAIYGGKDTETLRYWNPDIAPSDIPALFDATCHRQTICTMPITVTPLASDENSHEYSFDVVLPIGEVAPGMTRKFVYVVKAGLGGGYSVESLPGYVQ
jgi:hypothetical protein